jgi:hypothetical protein
MPTIREVALKKDGHTYLVRANRESHSAMLAALRRFAKNPDLDFSWNHPPLSLPPLFVFLAGGCHRERDLPFEFSENRVAVPQSV